MIKSIKHARADKTRFKYTIEFKKLTNLPNDIIGQVVSLNWSRGKNHKGDTKGYRVQKKIKTPTPSPMIERKVEFQSPLVNSTTQQPINPDLSTITSTPLSQQSMEVSSSKDTLTRKQAKLLLGNRIDGTNHLCGGEGTITLADKIEVPVTLYSSHTQYHDTPPSFEQKLLNISLLLGQLQLCTISIDLSLHFEDRGRNVIQIPFPSSSTNQPMLHMTLRSKCKDKEKKNLFKGVGSRTIQINNNNKDIHPSHLNGATYNNNNNININNNIGVTSSISNRAMIDNSNNILKDGNEKDNHCSINPTIVIVDDDPTTTSNQNNGGQLNHGTSGGGMVRDLTTESLYTATTNQTSSWSEDDSDDTFHINEKELAKKTAQVVELTDRLQLSESTLIKQKLLIEKQKKENLILNQKIEHCQTIVLEYEEHAHRAQVMEEHTKKQMLKVQLEYIKFKELQDKINQQQQQQINNQNSNNNQNINLSSSLNRLPTNHHSPKQQRDKQKEFEELIHIVDTQKQLEQTNQNIMIIKELKQQIESLTDDLETNKNEMDKLVTDSQKYIQTLVIEKDDQIKKLKDSLDHYIKENNQKSIQQENQQKINQKQQQQQQQLSSNVHFYYSLLLNPLFSWAFAIFCLAMFYFKSQDC